MEVTPLVIYGSSMGFNTQGSVEGPASRLLLESGAGYGVGFGLHTHEGNVAEVRWIRQDTFTGSGNSALALPRIKTTVDQVHVGFSHESVLKDRAPRVTPFVMASVGATSIKSALNASSTHFSVGIGGGLKFFVSRHVGFRVDTEWVPVFIGTRTLAICGGGCGLQLGGALASQAKVTIGPVLRFR